MKKMPDNKSHPNNKKCIICDMFGTLGIKSKLVFRDVQLNNGRTDIIGLPKHSPS